jgi:hypothetical protein
MIGGWFGHGMLLKVGMEKKGRREGAGEVISCLYSKRIVKAVERIEWPPGSSGQGFARTGQGERVASGKNKKKQVPPCGRNDKYRSVATAQTTVIFLLAAKRDAG